MGEDGSLSAKGGGTVNGGSLTGGAGCGVEVSREAGGMLSMMSCIDTIIPHELLLGRPLRQLHRPLRMIGECSLPFPVPHTQNSECHLCVTVEGH